MSDQELLRGIANRMSQLVRGHRLTDTILVNTATMLAWKSVLLEVSDTWEEGQTK